MTAELGATTTTDDVLDGIDLTGKRALVTGASTGLGEETARALAAHGAAVTMAVRDFHKGEQAAARIRTALPFADLPDLHLDIRQLELGSLASVRAFAAGFLADHDRLDLLILNAGVMACPPMTTERRVRAAVRHQPPRPLPAGRAARPGARGGGAVAGGAR